MNYNEATLTHFERAAQAGVLTGPAAARQAAPVGRGQAGAHALGTWVQFDIQLTQAADAPPTIGAARFLAFACPHVIAAADWVAARALGEAPRPRLPESVQELQVRFAVPIEKLGRLLIVEDAWLAAIQALGAIEIVSFGPHLGD